MVSKNVRLLKNGAIILIGLTLWVEAQGASADAVDSTALQSMEIYNSCIRNDFANQSGTLYKNKEYQTLPETAEAAIRGVTEITGAADYLIEESAHALSYLKSTPTVNSEQVQMEGRLTNFNFLRDQMIRKVKKEHLQDYQKACLVQCIASKVIDYQRVGFPLTLDPQEAIKNGEGVCREFSWIASRLMTQIGIKANREFVMDYESAEQKIGVPHAIVTLQLAGKEYLMEPQSDDCTFFTKEFDVNASEEPIGSFTPDKASPTM